MYTDRVWKSIKSRKAAWSDGGRKKRKDRKKSNGGHFIRDDICVSMTFAELQFATVTKLENHSSCQPALKGSCEKNLKAPFRQECLLNGIMWINRKQMCMFSAVTTSTCKEKWIRIDFCQWLISTSYSRVRSAGCLMWCNLIAPIIVKQSRPQLLCNTFCIDLLSYIFIA